MQAPADVRNRDRTGLPLAFCCYQEGAVISLEEWRAAVALLVAGRLQRPELFSGFHDSLAGVLHR